MKKYLFLCTVLLQSLAFFAHAQEIPIKVDQAWATDTILKTPESVFYDSKREILYVANINKVNKDLADGDGFISKVKLDGKIEKLDWITGLNDPKGMAIVGGTLYVSDLTQLVEIDIAKGTILKKHDLEGATFLNDVASNEAGDVIVSDSYSNKVYKLKDRKFIVWLEGSELDKPNGLFYEGEEVLVASMNKGIVNRVKHNSTDLKLQFKEIPSTDGIASDGKGNYFFSNWNGEVYFVYAKGGQWKIIDTKDQKINAADITFVPKQSLLLVPTFFGNRLVAYKITFKKK